MTEMLGCDPTHVALGFSCFTLVTGFTSLIVGDVIERIGLKHTLLIAALLFSGGFAILGVMTELWMMYVAYVVMGVGSSLGGMIIVSGIPANWFVKRRGVATGVTWCAMLPGSFITSWVVSTATAHGNWQHAAIILGVIAFIVMAVAAFLLKWRPQEEGLLPDGMTQEEAAQMAERAGAAKLVGLNRRQALKTPTFWLLFIAFALVGIGEQGPFQNFPTYLVGQGYDLALAGTFMTFLAFAGCCGKIAAGIVVDKVGPKVAYTSINYCAALAVVCIMFAGHNLAVLFIAGFFFGAALSSSAVCFSNATSKYLGPKHFGQLYGIVFLGKPVMDAIGVPLVTAISQSAIGWNGAFSVAAAFIVASATCMLLARKSKVLDRMEGKAAEELAREIAVSRKSTSCEASLRRREERSASC